MDVSATVAATIAVAGCVLAAAGLVVAWIAWVRVRRLREAQRVLVGGGRKDLVEFAVALQGRIDDPQRAGDGLAAALARVERRVDDTLANASIVRYAASEDTGGHQSASLALLDGARSGVVV